MSKRHQWNSENASRALMDFNLRKPRVGASDIKVKRKLQICKICSVTVKRIGNHLRQTHNLPNFRVREVARECVVCVDNFDENEYVERNDLDSDDEFRVAITNLYSNQLHNGKIYSKAAESFSDNEDEDWLDKQFSIVQGFEKPEESCSSDSEDTEDTEENEISPKPITQDYSSEEEIPNTSDNGEKK